MSNPKVIIVDLDGPFYNARSTLAASLLPGSVRIAGQADSLLAALLSQACTAYGHKIACISDRRSDPVQCNIDLINLRLGIHLHKMWCLPHPLHGADKASWNDTRGAVAVRWLLNNNIPLGDAVVIDDEVDSYAGLNVIASSRHDGVPYAELDRLLTFLRS